VLPCRAPVMVWPSEFRADGCRTILLVFHILRLDAKSYLMMWHSTRSRKSFADAPHPR
jgi:hypothetical protein